MSKTNTDGEVKQEFTEIIFAPFITLWSMVKTENEVADDEKKLDLNSSNKTEKELAESLESVDDKVNAKYGKRDRKEALTNAKLSRKQWKVKGIDSTKVLSNNSTRIEHTEQIEQEEDKTR